MRLAATRASSRACTAVATDESSCLRSARRHSRVHFALCPGGRVGGSGTSAGIREAVESSVRSVPAVNAACRVVVMTRAPVPGETKRRLISAIGAERAAALHRSMIRRAVATALASGVGPVELWCTPDTDHELFRALRDGARITLHAQAGSDLGARMHTAIQAGGGAAVVIGTDCPTLDSHELARAADELRIGAADVVIAPAFDGGYVLIALDRPRPELFFGVEWGSHRVLAQTRRRAQAAGLRLLELEPHHDIDRPEDLDALAGVLHW